MGLKPIDDYFLQHSHEVLDAEVQAFDALKHAVEDGDAATFHTALHQWRVALGSKIAWLHHSDDEIDGLVNLTD